MNQTYHPIRPILTIIALFLMGFLYVPTLSAQDEMLTVRVDRNVVAMTEQITLEVEVRASIGGYPTLPRFDDFSIAGSGRQSSTTIINGETSTVTTFTYLLRPTKSGTFQIDPFEVTIDGQIYQTAPFMIEVLPSEDSPDTPDLDADTRIFISAEVNKDTVYRGEQVEYLVKFYWEIGITERISEPQYPDFTGFWQHEADDREFDSVIINGKEYLFVEFTTYLFPSRSGELTINPTLIVTESGKEYYSDPVTVTVKPLPSPIPNNFQGAVGEYRVEARVYDPSISTNDTLPVDLSILGVGNIEIAPDVEWDDLLEWRTFEEERQESVRIVDGEVGGERIVRWSFIPKTGGTVTIPPFEYIYFDPLIEEYVTIFTEPIEVIVDGAVVALPTAEPTDAFTVSTVETPIPLQLHTESPTWTTPKTSLWNPQWALGGIVAIPSLLLLLGAVGMRIKNHTPKKKTGQANRTKGGIPMRTNESVRAYLNRSLSMVLGRSVNGKSLAELRTLLQKMQVKEDVIEAGISLYNASDMATYGGQSTADSSTLKKNAQRWIKTVQRGVKK